MLPFVTMIEPETRPPAPPSLSLVFPCCDEEGNVGQLIAEAVAVGEARGGGYEVIVVDDGSRDATAAIVEGWALGNPRVRLVRHAANRGYGAALRSGLGSATGELVFFADGDRQFRVADIDRLLARIDGADAVVGFRIGRKEGPLRRLNGLLWTRLNRLVFRLPVRDLDCAFKLLRREALAGIELKSDQLFIHAELLARLLKKGCRIVEVGVPHHPRTAGRPSATRAGRVVRSFGELVRLFPELRR